MCRILSQTHSHHPLLLWGHTCAISYPCRHIVTIPCYYGFAHVPYLIPDTESPSLAIMGSHMCHICIDTESPRLLLWGHTCAVLIPDTESPSLAIMG